MNQLVATDLFILMIDGVNRFTVTDLDFMRDHVRQAIPRIADHGCWPGYVDGELSLVSRMPSMLEVGLGFDAGLACALDMIPRNKQKLASTLHAAYTESAVEQVRREGADLDADSETTWWLAASICEEAGVNHDAFLDQLHAFRALAHDPIERVRAASRTLDAMRKNFTLIDGIPFVTKDGGLQGAYVSGYNWGVQYSEAFSLFFIGTFRANLGLETFPFSDRKDENGRPMSGPVHGSKQFVKVSSFKELEAATRFVREHLGSPKK